jgi:two-component system, NarL family, nitrate/nitrite response regulator NarL
MESALRLKAREIAIAIVRNETISRDGLTALLAQHDDLSVVASVTRADVTKVGDAEPDVILLEAEFEDNAKVSGVLAEACAPARIIVTGVSSDNCDLMTLVRAGVAGFVVKNASLSELVAAIRSVASGAQVMPPALIEAVCSHAAFERGPRRTAGPSVFDRMTPRERQILMFITNGVCTKDIARRIALSTHTVKSHVRNIMEKLGLHSRLEIAAEANAERWRMYDGHLDGAGGGALS